jgi:hypothetical protein
MADPRPPAPLEGERLVVNWTKSGRGEFLDKDGVNDW